MFLYFALAECVRICEETIKIWRHEYLINPVPTFPIHSSALQSPALTQMNIYKSARVWSYDRALGVLAFVK